MERWKNIRIKDYDHYLISDHGRVKNTKFNNLLKPAKLCNGYLRVTLSSKNKPLKIRVHTLVGMHFLRKSKDPNKIEINHIDCNKENNHYKNLKYVSRSENMIHVHKKSNINFNKNCLNKEKVIQIKELLSKGVTQDKIAKLFNVSVQHITNINTGRRWGKVQ